VSLLSLLAAFSRPSGAGPHETCEFPHSAAADAAATDNAAPTNLMESGTNGAATINGSSRQNLGNLGCWGVVVFGVVGGEAQTGYYNRTLNDAVEATYRMLFQGSDFSLDVGMLLSALLYASSAAFFFTWSSAFGASCCCLFPFAMAWAGAVTASKVIAIAAITILILKSFRIWTAC